MRSGASELQPVAQLRGDGDLKSHKKNSRSKDDKPVQRQKKEINK